MTKNNVYINNTQHKNIMENIYNSFILQENDCGINFNESSIVIHPVVSIVRHPVVQANIERSHLFSKFGFSRAQIKSFNDYENSTIRFSIYLWEEVGEWVEDWIITECDTTVSINVDVASCTLDFHGDYDNLVNFEKAFFPYVSELDW